LTCGSDGDIRIYKDFDDSDPESVRVGDNVTVLAVKVSIDWIVCVVVYLRLRKYRVIETRMEVWKGKKCCGDTSCR